MGWLHWSLHTKIVRRGTRMSSVGQQEILTQQRVIALFRDTLGYRYLDN